MAFFYKKTWRAGLRNLKFFMKTQEVSRKKTSQNNFFSVQPFIVKMQFEIWKYLPSKLFLPKYLSCRLHNSVQLVPTILFTSFLQPASIETDPIANHPSAVDHIQLVPKYISKVKLERGWSPNILSEIIGLHENEGRGGILAKISNWQLYIGRAA